MTASRRDRRRSTDMRLRSDDAALWRRAMHDVARLKPEDREPPARPTNPTGSTETAMVRQRPSQPELQTAAVPQPASEPPLERFAGIDRANAERLKRGRRAIEARLDLHGMTQGEAHGALDNFIH